MNKWLWQLTYASPHTNPPDGPVSVVFENPRKAFAALEFLAPDPQDATRSWEVGLALIELKRIPNPAWAKPRSGPAEEEKPKLGMPEPLSR